MTLEPARFPLSPPEVVTLTSSETFHRRQQLQLLLLLLLLLQLRLLLQVLPLQRQVRLPGYLLPPWNLLLLPCSQWERPTIHFQVMGRLGGRSWRHGCVLYREA